MTDSLDALHPIYIPNEVGFFPLSEGYVALLVFLVSVLISFIAFKVLSFRKDRFKREAIKELNKMRKTLQPLEVFELLKRASLSCDNRQYVASLSGKDFLGYLHLENEAIFLKAYDSIYDKNIVLSTQEKNSLYEISKKTIKRMDYVRD